MAKTLRELNDIFFYVGIPDNVGISYAFPSAKLAPEVARRGGTLMFTSSGIHLRASPKNSAYRFYRDLPGLTANCMIVSMVGTADAFSGPIMKTNGILTGKFVLLLGIGCAVLLASGTDANANRIPLPASINLTIGDQHELGKVQPATPEGDAAITQYVNFMIGLSLGGSGHVIIGPHDVLVNRSTDDFGQLPGPATLALRGTGTTVNLGLTGGTYDYLFAHYGGPRGGFAEVWYVGNLSGSISIPSIGFGHGLSGWALFTAAGGAVPDGGTTAMLLGAALGALGIVRRFFMG